MVNLCPICGSTPAKGARFCRTCGSSLKPAPGGGGEVVSPLAQTIPLVGEGRPTDGISPEDAAYSKPDTARVRQDEIERMFRQNPAAEGNGRPVEAPTEEMSASHPLSPVPVIPEGAKAGEQAVVAHASNNAQKSVATPSRRKWQLAAILLLFVALAAGTLAIFYSRQPAPIDAGSGASPIALSDRKKLVDDQLAEADLLLAAGDLDGAIAKLRYATRIDPANAEAHLRLGHALEKKGDRRAAIEEYKAATQSDAANTAAWRALAAAQSSEGLHQDSAESYTRLVSQMNDAEVDDNLRLEYADSLRRAGRTEEARSLYQKVSLSESRDLAYRASEQLGQLPLPQATGDTEAARDQRATSTQSRPADESAAQTNGTTTLTNQPVAVTPPQQPPPVNNRPAENNSEQFYRQALNIVQGRDVKTLQRAELLRALQLFQNVRDGAHSNEARKYAERLGKEYDRRRKKD